MELRILGPLEIRVGTDEFAPGGAKQRTVLATLLLRAGEIVPIERLIDELWGDQPPASAAHTLEVYVSRLRQLLNGHGPSLVRRGAGYVLDCEPATLDAHDFAVLAESVSRHAAEGEPEHVASAGRAALALWRSHVLADVELGPQGRADAERLEELRLRTIELRVDADLELGRNEHIVGELQTLVAQNPYRERFVAQLMLALYRSGRHAEALDAYEQTRSRLDADLGLQPSAELQLLSSQIVRQEPELRRAAPVREEVVAPPRPRERFGRVSGLVVVGAAAAAAMALSAAGGAAQVGAAESATTRVALVFQPGSPHDAYASWRASELTDGLHGLAAQEGFEAQVVELDDKLSGRDIANVAQQLKEMSVDLALVAVSAESARTLAPAVQRLPGMQSVFIDSSRRELALDDAPTITTIRFATEQPGQLAGALSGLVEPYSSEAGGRRDLVSVVAGSPTPDTRRLVAAFKRGVAAAHPAWGVRVGYTGETADPTACERLANRQINEGTKVILVHAGHCGTGALAVAKARRVWVVGSDGVGSAGENVVAAIFKDWDDAVYTAIHAFAHGELPVAADVVLGLDGYHVGLEMHSALPSSVASKVVALCSDLRIQTKSHTDARRSVEACEGADAPSHVSIRITATASSRRRADDFRDGIDE